jgi:hypothetical protein
MMYKKGLTALLGAVLLVGLVMGCKDLLHPIAPDRVVTFDLQGGHIDGATLSRKVSVENEGQVLGRMPPDPSRGGYTFGDWYTATNGGGSQFSAYTTVTKDITVYARWIGTTLSSGITNIVYSSVSGGTWTLQGDGSRKSPATSNNGVTKARVSFTSTAGASITIQLRVSSEAGRDHAFISQLDNADATYTSGYYTGSVISGEDSVTLTIPIASAGNHFIDIGYSKDGSLNIGGDCAWFTVIVEGGYSPPSSLSLAESLNWVANNAVDGGAYTITVNNNESIMPTELAYSGKNVRVSIVGGTTERTVSLSADGSLFTINEGATLTLGNNITLQGRSNNTASLVQVNNGGTLVMNDGSKISGNSKPGESSYGGGVHVYGTWTMNGGIISGNSAGYSGGGVYVHASGTWTMNGGTITDNEAVFGGGVDSFGTGTMSGGTVSGNRAETSGGGVYNGGTLTMSGGIVSGNTATYGSGVFGGNEGTFTQSGGTISGNTAERGGGVYVTDSTFTMRDGATISDNEAVYGGGVLVFGTWTMEGGTINGNSAETSGGGVYNGETSTMSGGTISGNTATYGGGVFGGNEGTFTQSGGIISGNTADQGGGVGVSSTGTFIKQTGGTIYGSNASAALKNTATDGGGSGHAVYVSSTPAKFRNSTAGVGVTLNSAVAGTAGGWETATSATPSVQIDLRPAWNNPSLADVSVFVNETAQFSTDGEYTSWAWYWNGERINGASASTYTITAHSKTPGVYELSVVVTTSAGETLSAQCWVTIKAN